MGEAYTPGLKVKKSLVVRRTRKLPIKGETLVKEGDNVRTDTIVARTHVPGDLQIVRVAQILGIELEDTEKYMVRKAGDYVKKDNVIAKSTSFFGLFKTFVKSPVEGMIEHVSNVTGQVVIREPPIPVEVRAYIPGTVVNVFPEEGVTIETPAAFIQGIFGIGGETEGKLLMVADSPEDALTADLIKPDHEGKILVGGSLVTGDALHKAVKVGAQGVIVGGIDDKDLVELLGYEIGVAITGHEDVGITLILTEGFGKMPMSKRTFALLKSLEGKQVSISGATQIRAGVIRPEIIIPLEGREIKKVGEEEEIPSKGLEPGTRIRVIREPYFGALGRVVSLPVELQKAETESYVRVLEAKLETQPPGAKPVVIPRANVEIIEE